MTAQLSESPEEIEPDTDSAAQAWMQTEAIKLAMRFRDDVIALAARYALRRVAEAADANSQERPS